MRLRPLVFATFLVWRLRIGACGVGAYDSYPCNSVSLPSFFFRRPPPHRLQRSEQHQTYVRKVRLTWVGLLLFYRIAPRCKIKGITLDVKNTPFQTNRGLPLKDLACLTCPVRSPTEAFYPRCEYLDFLILSITRSIIDTLVPLSNPF